MPDPYRPAPPDSQYRVHEDRLTLETYATLRCLRDVFVAAHNNNKFRTADCYARAMKGLGGATAEIIQQLRLLEAQRYK